MWTWDEEEVSLKVQNLYQNSIKKKWRAKIHKEAKWRTRLHLKEYLIPLIDEVNTEVSS